MRTFDQNEIGFAICCVGFFLAFIGWFLMADFAAKKEEEYEKKYEQIIQNHERKSNN